MEFVIESTRIIAAILVTGVVAAVVLTVRQVAKTFKDEV